MPIPDEPRPEIWVHEIIVPALVLGSTQRTDVVDMVECDRRDVEVVRRRSGGGAVWLSPGEVTWIDVIIPAGGPGWADDIHRPMVWFGHHLARAFADVGVEGVVVHDGAMVSTAHSRLVCFDGLGPGELTTDGGRGAGKMVGISQRRTRSAARLQCCWYSRHDHRDLTSLLVGAPDPAALRPVVTVGEGAGRSIPEAIAASMGDLPISSPD